MITMVLEASRIPDGTVVRKVTGQKPYTLYHEIKIYMPDKSVQVINGDNNTVFLLCADPYSNVVSNSINNHPDNLKLAVDLPEEDVEDFIATLKE